MPMQARRRRPPRPGTLTDLPPLRIVKKIALLQLAYYVCATVLIVFTALVAGAAVSPDLILSWRSLRGDTTVGWTLSFVWLLNSVIGVIFILLLVSRSKLVPDFALTLHFIHLVITSFYSRSLPRTWLWWGLQVVSSTLMTFLGIWACQWRELQPIAFGGSSSQESSNQKEGTEGAIGSLLRGMLGRGRKGDAGGEYEMVSAKEHSTEAV